MTKMLQKKRGRILILLVITALFIFFATSLPGLVNQYSDINDTSPFDYDTQLESYCNSFVSDEVICSSEASHFGANHPGTDNYDDMANAGIYWERFFIDDIFKPGKYTEDFLKEYLLTIDIRVMKAQSQGIQLVADIMFFEPIEDLDRFSDIVSRIVERYDADGINDMECLKYPIRYYMIGNEVSAKGFFSGSEEDYLDILITAHDAIKGVFSDALIVQAGMVSGDNNTYWENLLEMGAADYFDIVNIHEVAAYDSVLKVNSFEEFISLHGLEGREKWITEIQFENTNETPSLEPEAYAEITARYLAYALAHGYEKLFIVNFKFPILSDGVINCHGEPPFSDHSAMVNSLNEKTLVYLAVSTLTTTLDGYRNVEILDEVVETGLTEGGEWNDVCTKAAYRFECDKGDVYVAWGKGMLSDYLEGTYVVRDIYGREMILGAEDVGLTMSPLFVMVPIE